MENNGMLFMAYDGDNAGRLVGRAILADNPDALSEISARIELGHDLVRRWVEEHGGKYISGGGDEGTFSIPAQALQDIEHLREDYKFATNLTMTVGAGSSLSEAGKSLLVGKFRGKNTVVQYDQSIEQEIAQAQVRMNEGTASPEENKLGEAYLKPEGELPVENKSELDDCPYCAEYDAGKDGGSMDDCPYCAEYDAGKDSSLDDCPYCADMDHEQDCPYCAEYDAKKQGEGEAAPGEEGVEATAGPSATEPTTQDSESVPEGTAPAAIPKPDPSQETPPGLGATSDYETTDNQQDTPSNRAIGVAEGIPAQEPALPGSSELEETPAAILQQLDAEGPQPSVDDKMAVAGTDDAALAIGTGTEGNVSRPEDYDRDVPGDMGLGEDEQGMEPDLGGVLQDGLDDHAQNMQREKVVQMVSEALEGFKGCKQILEKAKDQAPQLYQSSLAMLRAMIEMAKLLGLGEATEETAEQVVGEEGAAVPGAEGQEEAHNWEEPFEQHPDHGPAAAAPEDAAPNDPKAQRQ